MKVIDEEKGRKRKTEDNRTCARAKRAVIDNPTLAHTAEEDQPEVDDDVVDPTAPHPTHELRRMHSHDVTYCNICGKWAGLNKHSQLIDECSEIKRGYKHALRLFQNVVVPGKGAQILAAATRRPGRKRA